MPNSADEYIDMMHARRRHNLRRLLDVNGMKQKDLARLTNYHVSHVSDILAAKRPFTEAAARRIEQFAGVEFGSLDAIAVT